MSKGSLDGSLRFFNLQDHKCIAHIKNIFGKESTSVLKDHFNSSNEDVSCILFLPHNYVFVGSTSNEFKRFRIEWEYGMTMIKELKCDYHSSMDLEFVGSQFKDVDFKNIDLEHCFMEMIVYSKRYDILYIVAGSVLVCLRTPRFHINPKEYKKNNKSLLDGKMNIVKAFPNDNYYLALLDYERKLVIGGYDGKIYVLKYDHSRVDKELLLFTAHESKMIWAICKFNEDVAISGGVGMTLLFWNVHNGNIKRKIERRHKIYDILSIKEQYIIVGNDIDVFFYDLYTGKDIARIELNQKMHIFILLENYDLIVGSGTKTWNKKKSDDHFVVQWKSDHLFSHLKNISLMTNLKRKIEGEIYVDIVIKLI